MSKLGFSTRLALQTNHGPSREASEFVKKFTKSGPLNARFHLSRVPSFDSGANALLAGAQITVAIVQPVRNIRLIRGPNRPAFFSLRALKFAVPNLRLCYRARVFPV